MFKAPSWLTQHPKPPKLEPPQPAGQQWKCFLHLLLRFLRILLLFVASEGRDLIQGLCLGLGVWGFGFGVPGFTGARRSPAPIAVPCSGCLVASNAVDA